MTENDTDADIARLTRERDEARERAAEVPGLRLRLAQAEGSASEAEAAWKTENGKRLASESRAASLSRELLAAMQARDSYRASAEIRVGMRREFEALLGCGDTTGEEAFERGLIRLRGLLAAEKELAEFSEILSRHNHEWSERCEMAESRAARLLTAMKEIESKTGHFGEAPPPPEWMPMLSLIAWVGRRSRAALAEVKK